jgi:transcriptional regulator with AAA-type ATPase domain
MLFITGSKEMETTAHNIGNVGELVNNIPAIVLQSVTSQLAEWRPMISISLDPLQNTWLASDLHQTLTRNKMSSPVYRHLAPISSTTIAEQTLEQSCDEYP